MELNRERITEILCTSFNENKSTNFVIKQGNGREKRLKKLIEYSLFQGENFGEVMLSEDGQACAILLNSEKKKSNLKSIVKDMQFVFQCVGLSRVSQVLKREAAIKKFHPEGAYFHLWYLGVDPEVQGQGKGSQLLQQIIKRAKSENKPIYLETSTQRNFPFYKKFGFAEVGRYIQNDHELKIFALS